MKKFADKLGKNTTDAQKLVQELAPSPGGDDLSSSRPLTSLFTATATKAAPLSELSYQALANLIEQNGSLDDLVVLLGSAVNGAQEALSKSPANEALQEKHHVFTEMLNMLKEVSAQKQFNAKLDKIIDIVSDDKDKQVLRAALKNVAAKQIYIPQDPDKPEKIKPGKH